MSSKKCKPQKGCTKKNIDTHSNLPYLCGFLREESKLFIAVRDNPLDCSYLMGAELKPESASHAQIQI